MNDLPLKLYMVLLGANPKGRVVEQHDYFFRIANNLKDLVPAIRQSWPEAKNTIHVDGWREVTTVNGFTIKVVQKTVQ